MAAAALPDGRAYEMVSPVDKNGADVLANSARTRAATDGDAVAFASLGSFGDAVGTGISSDYLSQRSASPDPGNQGWRTHALTPSEPPLSFLADGAVLETAYMADMSGDLTSGVLQSWSALTADPYVQDVENLYVRSNLRTPGAGAYQLVTACPLCQQLSDPLPPMPTTQPSYLIPLVAWATPDLGHVLFESMRNLTPDAPDQPVTTPSCADAPSQCLPRLYEYDHGTIRLAGILPDGRPAPLSIAGRGAGTNHNVRYTLHTISDDGSKVFFTYPTDSTGTVPDEGGDAGRLYMRLGGVTTVELSVSERSSAGAFSPAAYLDATPDGSKVLFMTAQALTDDAPGSGVKLYMYDTTKPPEDPHNLTYINASTQDPTNDVDGLLGISRTADYVYFAADGQLVPGEPPLTGGFGIYAWHDGTIDYVGKWTAAADRTENYTTTTWNFGATQARVTPDGRHLLFAAHADAGSGADHGSCVNSFNAGCRELYLYDAGARSLTCVSCRPGTSPVSDATTDIRTSASASATTWHLSHALADDGLHVFFTTGEPLVAGDANGRNDIYEYDVATGVVHLISSGKDPSDSYFLDATPDGRDVFFLTRERLVGWDVDNAYDIYDARVGGGFPEPAPAPPGCAGEGCHGPLHSAAAPPTIGSLAVRGFGNVRGTLRARRHCRRGAKRKRVRGRVRCVKRRARKRRAHRRGRSAYRRRAT